MKKIYLLIIISFLLVVCPIQAASSYDYTQIIKIIAGQVMIEYQDSPYPKEVLDFLADPMKFVQGLSAKELARWLEGSTIDQPISSQPLMTNPERFISVSLTATKAVFGPGEIPQANYIIKNNSAEEQTVTFRTYLEADFPVAPIIETTIFLKPGEEKFAGEIIGPRINDFFFESGPFTFHLNLSQPYRQSFGLKAFAQTSPNLKFIPHLVRQSDKSDKKEVKVFNPGQSISVSYTTIGQPQVNFKLTKPDGTTDKYNDKFSFTPQEIGVYNLAVDAWQTGWKPAIAQIQFAVIDGTAPLDFELAANNDNQLNLTSGQPTAQTVEITNIPFYKKLINNKNNLIFLPQDSSGKAYYISPDKPIAYYLGPGSALATVQQLALGMSGPDLLKIKLASLNFNLAGPDNDGDGLINKVEDSLGTDPWNPDSDNDGFPDGQEMKNGYNALGPGALPLNSSFARQFASRFLIQAGLGGHGEIWYVSKDNQRYFFSDLNNLMPVIGQIALGVSNGDWLSLTK